MKKKELKKILLENVWIVPEKTLKAYLYKDERIIPVQDQTVWVIENFDDLYFIGKSYTTLDKVPACKTNFIGSITPKKDVLITFNSGDNSFTGYGKFSNSNFLMQMNSLTDINGKELGVNHWSYMIPVKPSDKLYRHLPGVNISVPSFINLF